MSSCFRYTRIRVLQGAGCRHEMWAQVWAKTKVEKKRAEGAKHTTKCVTSPGYRVRHTKSKNPKGLRKYSSRETTETNHAQNSNLLTRRLHPPLNAHPTRRGRSESYRTPKKANRQANSGHSQVRLHSVRFHLGHERFACLPLAPLRQGCERSNIRPHLQNQQQRQERRPQVRHRGVSRGIVWGNLARATSEDEMER